MNPETNLAQTKTTTPSGPEIPGYQKIAATFALVQVDNNNLLTRDGIYLRIKIEGVKYLDPIED